MKSVGNNALNTMPSTQKGLIISIRSINPILTGNLLHEMVAEMFPPASLLAMEI